MELLVDDNKRVIRAERAPVVSTSLPTRSVRLYDLHTRVDVIGHTVNGHTVQATRAVTSLLIESSLSSPTVFQSSIVSRAQPPSRRTHGGLKVEACIVTSHHFGRQPY